MRLRIAPPESPASGTSGLSSVPSPLPEDARLVAAFRAGEERLIEQVILRWSPMMLRMAGRFARSSVVAEEIVQETWLAVIRSIDRFEFRSSLRNWALSILTNRAQSIAEREARMIPFSDLARRHESDDAPSPEDAPASQRSARDSAAMRSRRGGDWPHRQAQSGEIREALEKAIATLPPQQRAVLVLADVEDVAPEEVCQTLRLSDANRRVLLHRARAKVRRALHDYAP